MDVKQLVMLAFEVSIMATVFGFGMKTTWADLMYVFRRPGLLVRALVAIFVIMPLVVVLFMRTFTFLRTVEIALICLAISPVPPLLPKKETKAGGNAAFAVGLMAILSLLAIIVVPGSLQILGRLAGREFGMAPGVVSGIVLKVALAPLAIGMTLRALWPSAVERLEKPVALIAKVLLLLALFAMLFSVLPAMWNLIGNGTLFAIVLFSAVGLAIGHIFGGPEPDHAIVTALSTACRHPGIAVAIASANFPGQDFGAPVLLYMVVSAIVGIPYLAWQRRHRISLPEASPAR